MTDLPNRKLFYDRLESAIGQAKRYSERFAVLFLDLDNFKQINDTFGHEAGDHVLKTVSERLQATVRKSDTVARMGGDEFTVLLNRMANVRSAYGVSKKLAEFVTKPIAWHDQEFKVSTSIGIAMYPGDATNAEMLVHNADTAMYHAKNDGKNRIHHFDSSLHVLLCQEKDMEAQLDAALAEGQLIPYFQPQIDLVSGTIKGVEALVRWQHPERGFMMPGQFIPMAERNGQINRIDEWMLQSACAQVGAWQKAGLPAMRVSVNLNANLFRLRRLPDMIGEVLENTRLDPQNLCLEITESQVMQDVDSTIEILDSLKKMNVKISVDDFGTGYSSLSYLSRFPVDILKVDRSFLKEIPSNSNNAAITAAIVALAQSMKLEVIAEGVETREQVDFLNTLKCDGMQGFYAARPEPADTVSTLLSGGWRLN